ncbi:MAG: arylsulfatase [Puniceicoccaceae bacterium]
MRVNPLSKYLLSIFFILAFASTPLLAQRSSQGEDGRLCGETSSQPNVIIILTDDQGYGDVSAHGSPVLKTPETDKLRSESVHFSDFHVAPMCTPTRGQLMTGMDAMKTGATAVCQGRSMIRNELKLMPEYFADAGYATGMFGKWHLGDSYPHRPRFRGFQEVLSHRAWGITSLADYWGNTYFDPVLMRNGVDTRFKGYSTDIFFNEAMKWIDKCVEADKPFFLYLPTNTPHVPEIVAEEYSKAYQGKYKGKPIPAKFYGMIANIDENVGKLEAFLKERGLKDNTIFIYFTDNGTQNRLAMNIFNAGMRAKKTSVYEGGHRVPLFIRWNDGKLQHGKDISDLTQVQDILPTLVDLCDLDADKSEFDGASLSGLLKGKQKALPERMCVVQYRISGEKWDPAVVMNDKWRLVNGVELYNVAKDPSQEQNVIEKFPEMAKSMSDHYDAWYTDAKKLFDKKRHIIVGSKTANPVRLYSSDWDGGYCDNPKGLKAANTTGFYNLEVARAGEYEFELRRWSEESAKHLTDSYDGITEEGARPIAKARLRIAGGEEVVDVDPLSSAVKFRTNLKKGNNVLWAEFLDAQGELLCGAIYVKVSRL